MRSLASWLAAVRLCQLDWTVQAQSVVTVDWNAAPLAITPMVATVHDCTGGASGNPHHDGADSVYPPTKFDIVDAIAARRRELASPLARLWWDTSVVMKFSDNRTTAWGPEPAPPNTTQVCSALCPGCPCCPADGYVQPHCYCCDSPFFNPGYTTSWNFSAMDVKVLRFQESVVDPASTVLQVTGNNPEPWWFNYTAAGDGAPTNDEHIGHYFSRVLDWYGKGGFTDELGVFHHSGHNVTFGYLEVLNEVDFNRHIYFSNETGAPGSTCAPHATEAECAAGLVANVRRYIALYDAVVRVVHQNHPHIKFVGNCLAGRGDALDSLVWRTFLNRSEHASDIPWPIDAVSYHMYVGIQGGSGPPPPWEEWPQLIVGQAKALVPASVAAAAAIKEASPRTRIFLDEVGICNVCFGSLGWMDMNSTLGSRPNATFNNLQSVVLTLWYGEMAAAGADMIASSQLLGWVGDLYQPSFGQGAAYGNCPDLSLLDWETGEGNARFHTEKMIIDSLGSGMKHVLETKVIGSAAVYARAFSPGADVAGWPWHWPDARYQAAVLLANLNTTSHEVRLAGAVGGELWSVTFGVSGFASIAYRKEQLVHDSFMLGPLATAVVLLVNKTSS